MRWLKTLFRKGSNKAQRVPDATDLANACLYFRHDFGLLPDSEMNRVMFEAKHWLEAWNKAFEDKDKKWEEA